MPAPILPPPLRRRPESSRPSLGVLRERVEALEVRACGLVHERVRIEGGRVLRRSRGAGEAPAFVRIGLCDHEARGRQLACAHTTARDAFEEVLGELADAGVLSDAEAAELRAEVRRVGDVIHRADWAKGEAEAAVARLHDEPRDPERATRDREIAALVDLHQACVASLRRIRAEVLARLDGADRAARLARTAPEQHLTKPGRESELEPRPNFLAPDYRGSEKLGGKVALITGGDSGIGRAVAVLFAREGADVAVAYLDEHEDAEETKRAVEAEGRRCVLISGDVRDSAFCDAAVEHAVRELGGLDVLVNNAAFQEHVQSLDELTDEHLEMTLKTNVQGYIQMARAALPHLKRGSCIINTRSETGFFGQPVLLDYSTTKGAIHAFTKALARNLAPKGIRVNAVAPGPVWTPLNPADQPPEKIAEFGAGTDMKRPAQPEELAPAYVFLAAPVCSSYVTGAVIPVMGGVTGTA